MRVDCAMEGAGITSIVAWTIQVDRESHCVKIKESSWRVSLDFKSREGTLRLSAVTIFVTLSGFLNRLELFILI
jgi:hypothetical protein